MAGCKLSNQEFILNCFQLQRYSVSEAGDIISYYGPGGSKRELVKTLSRKSHSLGYIKVALSDGKVFRLVYAHVVVWLYFNQSTYSSQLHVNHVDGIKTNNVIANLELISFKDNAAHAAAYKFYRNKDKHPRWVRDKIDTTKLIAARLAGKSVRECARLFGVSPSTISRIVLSEGVKIVRLADNKFRNPTTGRFH